jgi:pyruvate kinase
MVVGDQKRAFVTYSSPPEEGQPGDKILLVDRPISLKVLKSDGKSTRCQVIV